MRKKKQKGYHCLTWNQRLQLEAYLKAKLPKKEIALLLGVHISTVYREIKRGMYNHKKTSYDCIGEKIYKFENRLSCF